MKKTYLLIVILNIFIAIVGSKILLLKNNTLLNNGNWNSEKTKLEMGVMGSWQFFSETQPLNKNDINLSSWHGFQEIISKNTFKYNQIEFDALITNEAYLINHFLINDNQKISIRISEEPAKNYCLIIDQDGKFIEKISLNNINIEPNKWFHTKIYLDNNKATITVNNQSSSCPVTNIKQGKVGFKGGQFKTLVDNIVIRNDSKMVFKENFSNNKNLFSTIIFIFIFLTLIQLLSAKKYSPLVLISANLSLLFSIMILYLYLLFFFIGNYPNIESLINNLKTKEEVWIDNEITIISNKIMSDFKNDNNPKIMFIGSSQTWGAGASEYKKTFPALIEKQLNDKIIESTLNSSSSSQILNAPTNQKIKVINAGVSGTTSTELLTEYINKWIELKPKILFINLSNNDFEYGFSEEVFRTNIQKFIELNEENNIKTILLMEANSIELNVKNPLHKTLKEISRDKNVPLIDINKHLEEKNDTGLVWWDFVHPTDYGHKLIAEYILDKITENENIIQ